MPTVQEMTQHGYRALFKIDVTQDFFRLDAAQEKEFGQALAEAFSRLRERFGVRVLGTFDDDLLNCGWTSGDPCLSYILAEVPTLEAVIEVTNLVRVRFQGTKLAKYVRIESRIGRPLFFGNE